MYSTIYKHIGKTILQRYSKHNKNKQVDETISNDVAHASSLRVVGEMIETSKNVTKYTAYNDLLVIIITESSHACSHINRKEIGIGKLTSA